MMAEDVEPYSCPSQKGHEHPKGNRSPRPQPYTSAMRFGGRSWGGRNTRSWTGLSVVSK